MFGCETQGHLIRPDMNIFEQLTATTFIPENQVTRSNRSAWTTLGESTIKLLFTNRWESSVPRNQMLREHPPENVTLKNPFKFIYEFVCRSNVIQMKSRLTNGQFENCIMKTVSSRNRSCFIYRFNLRIFYSNKR